MNYRHAYHAGNFADVLKHTVLLALIEALRAKATPFCVIDTHAGSGAYALDSHEAVKTGEFKDGIRRLLYPDMDGGATPESLPPLLRRWLDSILAHPENADGLSVYPGSPLQAAAAMREQDSGQFCELHPEEAERLRERLRHEPHLHVHHRDGYEALKALLPPAEKRGLVLIDPPYEAQEAEYKLIDKALRLALERWPTGIFAVWYPIKLRSQVQPFLRDSIRTGARRVLRAELLIHPDDSPLRLNGAGMLILNAPWKLDQALREPLRAMARRLSREQPAQWTLDWLLNDSGEASAAAATTGKPTLPARSRPIGSSPRRR